MFICSLLLKGSYPLLGTIPHATFHFPFYTLGIVTHVIVPFFGEVSSYNLSELLCQFSFLEAAAHLRARFLISNRIREVPRAASGAPEDIGAGSEELRTDFGALRRFVGWT